MEQVKDGEAVGLFGSNAFILKCREQCVHLQQQQHQGFIKLLSVIAIHYCRPVYDDEYENEKIGPNVSMLKLVVQCVILFKPNWSHVFCFSG